MSETWLKITIVACMAYVVGTIIAFLVLFSPGYIAFAEAWESIWQAIQKV